MATTKIVGEPSFFRNYTTASIKYNMLIIKEMTNPAF